MEKSFTCSKESLIKARINCWFSVAGILFVAFLFSLPFILGKMNSIDWISVIYLIIEVYFLYKSYRAYRVIRSLRKSICRIEEEFVSGISIPDPLKKGIEFRVSRNDITSIDEKYIIVKTENLLFDRSLHRPPASTGPRDGYRSALIYTKDEKYVLFGIELTEELKKSLKPE